MLQVSPVLVFLYDELELQIKNVFGFKDTKRLLESSLSNETKRHVLLLCDILFIYIYIKSYLLFI